MTQTSTISSVHLGLSQELPVIAHSTTSRVILNNDILRVIEFTFDAGELLTEHTSPKAVVVQLIEGEMNFNVNGQTHTFLPGDVIYLAPGEPHALTAVTECRMSLVMVHTDKHCLEANNADSDSTN
ncbi:AraC-like ligand binding domain [Corynebacterium kutscheri]|uniref:AraC-like regulator n=1 Tax=Corynebacterium kutscheri TaxID=35755 RepID=A0A0F6TCA7_9CORY|nr:cupin domain-containing protein [Corynebacterium kutscheri]AKE40531.1 AraC-like regulator [Corynebacterium kutscheri]VEH10926.1 AraC-like ligand binding domain [Corynebacterium kutscheri]VEH80598.1 AraC-like ligand binding domain [Corynebacterium kutscheri]